MFRYYQLDERSKWEPIADAQDIENKAVNLGAKKLTILAVSEVIDDDNTDYESLSYKGNLYFDIDNKDLREAINSAIELIEKLLDLGVVIEAIQIFASGGKGFHIIVYSTVFSSGRAIKGLPYIYREMALDLHVLGMDFQVYSAKRGVCWRLPNTQRDDGNYRVPITYEELKEMTPERYREIVSTPRIVPTKPAAGLPMAPGLATLMEQAKRRVKAKPPRSQSVITQSQLEQFRESPPECINHLADAKYRKSANFNEAGLQMAIYVARSGTDDRLSASLLSRMADNSGSSKYSTPKLRLGHLQGLQSYLSTNDAKQFSCSAMRSILGGAHACKHCPLASQSASTDDSSEEIGIEIKPDGYYSKDKKITTFTMRVSDMYQEADVSGEVTRVTGYKVEVLRGFDVVDEVMLDERCWTSALRFKEAMRGVKRFCFVGTNDDVQKIKYLISDESNDMNNIVQTRTAGIHKHKVGNTTINVYVEPGFSINEIRMKGTHELNGKLLNAPALHKAKVPPIGDPEIEQLMTNLLDINSDENVGQIIGWMCACHLKTHLMEIYHQFPLLNLWGNAGSGKSMTAMLASGIGGANYFGMGNAPTTLASITKWSMIELTSRTTTIPRVLEEFNKNMLEKRTYSYCTEIMKSAYNGLVVPRGSLTRSTANGTSGVEVTDYPILSPIVVVSEQEIDKKALKQRCIQVCLTHASRAGKEETFFAAMGLKDRLPDLALALVVKSLSTHSGWIQDRMEHWSKLIDKDYIDRSRYAYCTALVGLDLLNQVMEELEVPVLDRIALLQEAIINRLEQAKHQMTKDLHATEVDDVVRAMAYMAKLTAQDAGNWLRHGTHYQVKEGILYIDVGVAFEKYKAYCKMVAEPPTIATERQFKGLLIHEYYCDSASAYCEELGIRRRVYALNLTKMEEKGIDSQLFHE